MLNWPVVVCSAGDTELVFYESMAEWEAEYPFISMAYNERDCVIDSSGRVYALDEDNAGKIAPVLTDEQKSVEQVLGLVKAHAAQAGSCCVAKLWAPTITEAFYIVKSLSG